MRALLLSTLLAGCAELDEPGILAASFDRPEVRFGFPLAEPARFYQTVGVDHDPVVQQPGIHQGLCTDYLGRAFPWCYDEHQGTDYLLEGGFEAMDAGSVEILAAADGLVIDRDDGHYDRCAIVGATVDCDGGPLLANYVILAHANGLRTLYWHMAKDSVAVEVGDEVRCGDVLGLVGSSGNSSMPHLHFEVRGPNGAWIDPYAGPFSQDETYWDDQGPAVGLPEPGCTDA